MDIEVTELKKRMDAGTAPEVIDVREPWEFENDHITDKNIPLGDLPGQLEALAHLKGVEFIVACRSGGRSGRAADFLRSKGFAHVRNLTGGMLAWKAQVDSNFNVE